ncbi:hypothetical protein DB346_19215 [Verrucomicrobia bacterium LW23]|nr:hypothetical protein DB346_19215 [Verrucomicrobia bacterium LW23]
MATATTTTTTLPATASTLDLRDVHLTVRGFELQIPLFSSDAEVLGIFGPSGAGKTSLLEIITGLRTPRMGRIILRGQPVFDSARGLNRPSRTRRIGYVPQDGALFPHLNVRDNLLFGARARRGAARLGDGTAAPRGGEDGSTSDIGEEIALLELAQILELDKLMRRNVLGLSGGEQQRVALGRALLSGARMLLLDEPLASLDDAKKARALGLLRRVRDHFRVPIIYVSHDRDEMRNFADEVAVISAGRITSHGPPAQVLRRTLRDLATTPGGTRRGGGTVSEAGAFSETSASAGTSAAMPDTSHAAAAGDAPPQPHPPQPARTSAAVRPSAVGIGATGPARKPSGVGPVPPATPPVVPGDSTQVLPPQDLAK